MKDWREVVAEAHAIRGPETPTESNLLELLQMALEQLPKGPPTATYVRVMHDTLDRFTAATMCRMDRMRWRRCGRRPSKRRARYNRSAAGVRPRKRNGR